MGSRISALLAVAALLLTSRAARGSAVFPDLIKQQLGVNCPPACTICHNNPNGGMGTANTPFAMEALNLGLRGSNPASLRNALNALKTQDPAAIQALIECMDPNDAPSIPFGGDGGDDGGSAVLGGGVVRAGSRPPTPQYGCSVERGPGGTGGGAIGLIMGFLLWRQRSRRNHAL